MNNMPLDTDASPESEQFREQVRRRARRLPAFWLRRRRRTIEARRPPTLAELTELVVIRRELGIRAISAGRRRGFAR